MARQQFLQRPCASTIVPICLFVFLAIGGVVEGRDLSTARSDTMYLQLWPHETELAPGDTLHVDLIVPVAGLQFNAYDAFVSYDPEVFTFLQQPGNVQQGPLMTGACGLTFHIFTIAADSTHLEINHSLLCGGMSLTGPGVVYRLRFRCNDVDADSWLRLLRDPPTRTRAYNAGLFVQPLVTIDALVRVGAGSSSTVPPASSLGMHLRAAPNPFNPQTVITFVLDAEGECNLEVFSLDGRRLRTLANGHFSAGEYSLLWDGRDQAGRCLAAGVYLVRLQSDRGFVVRRVAMVR